MKTQGIISATLQTAPHSPATTATDHLTQDPDQGYYLAPTLLHLLAGGSGSLEGDSTWKQLPGNGE